MLNNGRAKNSDIDDYNIGDIRKSRPGLIFVFLNLELIIALVSKMCLLFDMNPQIATYVNYAISILLFIYTMIDSVKKRQILSIVIFIIITCLCSVLSMLINEELLDLVKSYVLSMILYNTISYYIGKQYLATNNSTIYILFEKGDFYVFICYVFIIVSVITNTLDDYMTISYSMLFITCFSWVKACVKKKLLHYFHSLFFMTFILVFGARGPLLTCLFVILITIIVKNDNYRERVKRIVLLLLGTIGAFFVYKPLIMILYNLFSESRTLLLLLTGATGNIRQNIWEYSVKLIRENPYKIRGIFADRIAITNGHLNNDSLGMYVSKDMIDGLYAHNLVLEILVQFGVILGGIILFALVLRIIEYVSKYLLFDDSMEHRVFSLLILIVALVPLMFSNSYLLYRYFWIAIGMISVMRRVRFVFGNIK